MPKRRISLRASYLAGATREGKAHESEGDAYQSAATASAIGRWPAMTENVLPIVLGALSVSASVAATSPRLTLP